MLTKLTIRNFKRFGEVEIELGNPVVFIGPNNSGKTSAMQALALWDIGLKRWNEKRSGKKSTPEKRPGVTVNRRDLVAIPSEPLDISPVECLIWKRREIENYICSRATLEKYASASASASEDAASGPLFAAAEVEKRQDAMSQAIEEVESALKTLGKGAPWSADIKASDDFLIPLFKSYFETLGLPNLMAKKNFYELAGHVPASEIDPEVSEKLDAIVRVAECATPVADYD